MAVKCMNIIDNNTALHKAVVELFADTKIEVTSDMEIRDFPPGYEIEMGSILTTGDFNVAVMGSDGIWKWEDSSSSRSAFNGELVYDGTILEGYKVSVKVPSGITKIGDNAFKNLTGLENVNITEGVTLIGDYAFYGCIDLKTVKIASTVTGIGDSAFKNCTGLETVYCEPTTPPSLGTDAFDGITSSCIIYVPDASYVAYATSWNDMTDYLLPAGGTVEVTTTGNPISMSDAVAHNAISTILSYSPKQGGSGDPSPQNIRPISGWTGANATVAGKNLFDIDNAVIVPRPLGISGTDGIKFIPPKAGTYTVRPSVYDEGGRYQYLYGYLVHSDGTRESAIRFSTTSSGTYNSGTFVCVEGDYIFMNCALASGGSSNWIIYSKPQVELGSQATDYTPYITPSVYPVTWQTEAGTIFGGEVDFVRGKVRAVNQIYQFTGEETIYYSEYQGYGRFSALVLTDAKSGTNVPVACSHYKPSTAPVYANNANNNICGYGTQAFWRDDSIANETDMKTYLAQQYANGTPVSVVFTLATPLEYDITPTDIPLLLGNNTIWTDGDSVALSYLAITSQHQEPTPLLGLTSLSRGISDEEENPDIIEEPIEEEFIENLEENPEEDIIDTPVEEETTENDER